ncbi:MAG: hypothetical protein PSV22_00190 [Pseudolabrys sp.]|nr:hypothetical protein [Pseudolabrys sp.]
MWLVVVSIGAVKRVRELAGVDLLRFFDPKQPLAAELSSDPIALASVLWSVCEPQATKLGVSAEEFGESLYGDAIASGAEALIEAMVDFSPHPKERDALRRVLKTAKRVTEKRLEAMTFPSEAEMELEMTKALSGGSSSGVAPG